MTMVNKLKSVHGDNRDEVKQVVQEFASRVHNLSDRVWSITFKGDHKGEVQQQDYEFAFGLGIFERSVHRLAEREINSESDFAGVVDSLYAMIDWLESWAPFIKEKKGKKFGETLDALWGECLDATVDLIGAWLNNNEVEIVKDNKPQTVR